MQLALIVIQLALISVAFGLCGFLFLTLKRELHRSERKLRSESAALTAQVDSLAQQLEQWRKEVESIPAGPAVQPGSGINLNKRTKALRMLRMGEGPGQIAATLSMPRKEIQLLVKVQKMIAEATAAPTS